MPKKIIITIFSLVSMVIVSELVIRKIIPQQTFSRAVSASFDCYLQDKLIPFSLQKNSVCRMVDIHGDFDTQATINSLGYRGKDITLAKPSGTTRILMLGDSFTFGLGVSDTDTFASKLEQALIQKGKKTEVINAGYADGFSPDSYFLYFKTRGILLAPDIVIVNFFVWNDITDLSETVWEKTDSEGLPEKITSCCQRLEDGVLIKKYTPLRYRYPLLRESHLFQIVSQFLSLRFGRYNTPLYSWRDTPAHLTPKRNIFRECIFGSSCKGAFLPEERKTYQVIVALNEFAKNHDKQFLLVLLPLNVQLYPDAWKMFGSAGLAPEESGDYIQRRIKESLSDEKIPILDLYQEFEAQKKRGYPYFPHDQHFNPIGHTITAQAILNYLQEKNYILRHE